MARKLVPDDLWAVIGPLLPPPPPPSPKGGRPRLGDRQALTGILSVLRTGLPREGLPAESGCGMSCRRRPRDWQADGTWARTRGGLLDRPQAAGELGWSKCVVDSSSVRAAFGGRRPAPTRRPGRTPAPSTAGWRTGRGCRWRPR